VDEKRKIDVEKQEKKDAKEAELDALTPLLDVAQLKRKFNAKQLSNSDLILQINWHRRHDANILSRTTIGKMKREDKLTQLIVAVERYNMSPVPPPITTSSQHGLAEVTRMDWEVADDVEDADMED
jgi:hypothetical protein